MANILICLIHQTNYLLDHLIRKLEKAFVEVGGLGERMTRSRLAERANRKVAQVDLPDSPKLSRIWKSSSRYYCADVVHSTSAKEKFRWLLPLQSADSGG